MVDRAQFDQNNRNAIFAVSNDGQRTPVELWADPTTHELLTKDGGGGGTTSDVNLIEVGGTPFSLGQQLAAGSVPIVLTAAQLSTLTPPAALTNYSLETGGNLASIKAKTDNIPALGQALAAASVPVVLTAAQFAGLTPPAAITNYALETGGNLASIKAKTDNIPALGQALAAGSVPVVLTAAQLTTLTPPAAITNYALETGGNIADIEANQTNSTQRSRLTDGTTEAGVVIGDTGFSGVATGAATKTYTFANSGSGAQVIGPFNTEGFAWITVTFLVNTVIGLIFTAQTSSTSGGTYVTQQNFSNATSAGSATPGILLVTTNVAQFASVVDNYFRLNVTAYPSGTLSGTITLSNRPIAYHSTRTSAAQDGTWTVGSNSATGVAVPANAFYVGLQQNSGDLSGWLTAANGVNSVGSGIGTAQMLAQLDDTTPTSITENRFGNLRMSTDRSLLVTNRATTPALTNVAGSASSVTILAANNDRKGAIVTNDSSAVLYLKFGSLASTTSYTVTVAGSAAAPFASYEVPFGYVGVLTGLWASATGNARVTEIT